MRNFNRFVEERDQDNTVNRVMTTLGINPGNTDGAMDDPLDTYANKDNLKKELPQMNIDATTRAAAINAIDEGKMSLRDFLALLSQKDPGEFNVDNKDGNDPLQVTGSPEGFTPGGGTAAASSPM